VCAAGGAEPLQLRSGQRRDPPYGQGGAIDLQARWNTTKRRSVRITVEFAPVPWPRPAVAQLEQRHGVAIGPGGQPRDQTAVSPRRTGADPGQP